MDAIDAPINCLESSTTADVAVGKTGAKGLFCVVLDSFLIAAPTVNGALFMTSRSSMVDAMDCWETESEETTLAFADDTASFAAPLVACSA